MENGNKKWIWATAILAMLLIALLGFLAGMYFGKGNNLFGPGTQTVDPGTPQINNGGSSGDSGTSGSGMKPSTSGSSSSGSSTTGSGSDSSSKPETPSVPSFEILTTRQILDSSMYWGDDSGYVGLMATAGGNYDVMIGDEVFHTLQILILDEDEIEGFTYNCVLDMESYVDDHEATSPLYCYQDEYGGCHMKFLTWDGIVLDVEPMTQNPLKKFAQ